MAATRQHPAKRMPCRRHACHTTPPTFGRNAQVGVLARLWRLIRPLCPLALAGVTGCTTLSSTSVETAKLVVNSYFPKAPTLEQVTANPYAQLEIQTAQGQAVLVLGNVDGTREAWYGNPHVVVFLDHGRVVQTVGLDHGLDGLHASANDPFIRGLQTLTAPMDYVRTEDWSPGYRYGVIVDARLVPAGRTEITILGTPHTVLRVDEQLSAPAAGYHATNHYWVDPRNGYVWKSEQHVTPQLTLTLTALRPYLGSQP
jgi:hypothetical protein